VGSRVAAAASAAGGCPRRDSLLPYRYRHPAGTVDPGGFGPPTSIRPISMSSSVGQPWWKRLAYFLRRENLHRVLLILVLLVFLGAWGLWVSEPEMNLADTLWWSIVTLTTVGYGDVTPRTLPGRLIGVVLMFFGIGILSMLTATIASFFVQRKLMKERGMGTSKLQDHIILCQWNYRTREILRELRADPRTAETPILLVADLDHRPVDDERVELVSGPVDEETLLRAGVDRAATVIILGDDRLEPHARDSQVVLVTLTVESLNPDAHTIVELVDGANEPHCRRARADEVICGDQFSARLIASAALDHGLTRVVSEFLSQGYGATMETVPLPAKLVGSEFFEALCEMKKANNFTLLGVERNHDVLTNPPADYRLEVGDRLIAIVDRAAG